jgi:fluoroquinolone resistance protein
MGLNRYDEEYQDIAFDRHNPPPEGPRTAFRDCRFVGCDMTGMNMKNCLFSSCDFVRCNLSLLQVDGARFLEAAFQDCKLAGVNFALCDDFLLRLAFEECRLQQCSFAMLSMPGTSFRRCDIQGCDFVQADLTGADFSDSRLTGSLFDNTTLVRCNFRGAQDYAIHVLHNRVAQATFTLPDAMALLAGLGIHLE